MRRTLLGLVLLVSFLGGCTTTVQVDDAAIEAAARGLDFGDFASNTLTTKAWEALEAKDYLALFAYTRECVERYGTKGKEMNASLSGFAASAKVHDYWALNDVGTSLFIMGTAYADLKMYGKAADAFESLAADYGYAQCWDPRGWFWHPAEGATLKAERYRRLASVQS